MLKSQGQILELLWSHLYWCSEFNVIIRVHLICARYQYSSFSVEFSMGITFVPTPHTYMKGCYILYCNAWSLWLSFMTLTKCFLCSHLHNSWYRCTIRFFPYYKFRPDVAIFRYIRTHNHLFLLLLLSPHRPVFTHWECVVCMVLYDALCCEMY
jgi:hypothetical protein